MIWDENHRFGVLTRVQIASVEGNDFKNNKVPHHTLPGNQSVRDEGVLGYKCINKMGFWVNKGGISFINI